MIKVMIVEDDPMVAEFNKRYLEQVEGFLFIGIARTTREALDYVEQKKIDLILLDIYMPRSNGLEFLTEIRRLDKEIDIIMITASSDKVSIEKALRYGAVDYLIKPFEFERFQMALTKYRNDKKRMTKQESFSQEQLDSFIFQKDDVVKTEHSLPKGLTKSTLKNIYDTIQKWGEHKFTTEQLGLEVGISRVSIRKYLTFLKEVGVIEEDVVYGSVGRPQYEYKRKPRKMHIIDSYL